MIEAEPGDVVQVVRADPFFMDRVGRVVEVHDGNEIVVAFEGFRQRFRNEQLRALPDQDWYVVSRHPSGQVTCVVVRDGASAPLRHLVVHSPTGFETGYDGSGPSDLALSILADFLEVDRDALSAFSTADMDRDAHLAWHGHADFRARFIAPQQLMPSSAYVIRMDAVRDYVAQLGAVICERAGT